MGATGVTGDPGDPTVEEVRGWTPAAREKIKNRVRARKKVLLGHIEEHSREVLNKRANAIVNPMPSASRAVGRVKESHAEAVARRAALNIPADATPAKRKRIMMKSARERDKTLQKAEWHEARRIHHLVQKRIYRQDERDGRRARALAADRRAHQRAQQRFADPRGSSGPTVLEARTQLQHDIFSNASS